MTGGCGYGMAVLELVRPASELADAAATGGVDRLLPVVGALRPLFPGGGLRRGSTVAVSPGPGPLGSHRPGSRLPGLPPLGSRLPESRLPGSPLPGSGSLVLALLAEASAAGAWAAVVGMPGFGVLAAAQAGVALERLALVPYPGPEWTAVVAALLDGVDVVVVAPPGPVSPRVTSRLAARARLRGSVLLPYGRWDGADLTLNAEPGEWQGLGAGHGRLRDRELTITARGRGAAGQPRQVQVRLPDATGRPTRRRR